MECGPWALALLASFEMPSLRTLAISLSKYQPFEDYSTLSTPWPLAAVRHLLLYAMSRDQILRILSVAPNINFLALSDHRNSWGVEDIRLVDAGFLPCLRTLSLYMPKIRTVEVRKVVENRVGTIRRVDLASSVGEWSHHAAE